MSRLVLGWDDVVKKTPASQIKSSKPLVKASGSKKISDFDIGCQNKLGKCILNSANVS